MKYGWITLVLILAGSSATAQIVGNDRDAHGCIGSAGYSWCARTNKCERPWELAKEKALKILPKPSAAIAAVEVHK